MANYFIMGGDLKEYGPVSPDELRKWIAEKRVNAQTKVRREDATGWLPLSDVPELAGMAGKTAPPPLPTAHPPATGKTSALAVASLVLGILGVCTCGATAIFGLVLGIIALVMISNSQGALRGKGMALTGTILSGVFLLMLPVLAAMLLPALAAAKQKAQEINCMNNEKQLVLAVRIYSDANTNTFPPAATWCDAIKTNVGLEKVFKCPAAPNAASRCDYAFNNKLDGMDAAKIDPQTVVIFESDAGWDAHGGPELMASHRHPKNGVIVGFADGHVEAVPPARLNSLRWNP